MKKILCEIHTFRNAVNASFDLHTFWKLMETLLSADFNVHINRPEVIQEFRANWHTERQKNAEAIGWNTVMDL